MESTIDEIAEGVYRLSTFMAGVGGPAGMTFNQFLFAAEQPLLFHCGQQALFPSVLSALRRVLDPSRLRWITYSHAEADECGALNSWLAVAPQATAAHTRLGCNLWLTDQANRAPRALSEKETLDLGGKRVRLISTPHVPHCWDAAMLFEEATGTLCCTDLFTHLGNGPAVTTTEPLEEALRLEERLPYLVASPHAVATLRRLAALAPRTLAIMHGSSFAGPGKPLLEGLAAHYERQLQGATPA